MSPMTRRLLLPLMLLLAPLAGCLGDEAPSDADEAAPQAASPTAAAPAARDPEPAAPAAPAAAEPAADAPLVDAERDASWSGQFGRGAIVCAPTGCVIDPLHEDTKLAHALEMAGGGARVQLTLTWTPDTPATERLRFGMGVTEGEEATRLAEVEGVSPLVLEVDAPFGGAGALFWMYVGPVHAVEPPVPAHAWTTQPFEVTGTLVERVAAP